MKKTKIETKTAKKTDSGRDGEETSERIILKRGVCYFCTNKKSPDYKEWETLSRFLSDRVRITGSKRSGTCAKHQRAVTREIKRAQHLSLLPFTPRI